MKHKICRKLRIEVKSFEGRTVAVFEACGNSDLMILMDAMVSNTFMSYTLIIGRAEMHWLLRKANDTGIGYSNQTRLIHQIENIYNGMEELSYLRIIVSVGK